jgi:branched-chain amino acid transport system permease protein
MGFPDWFGFLIIALAALAVGIALGLAIERVILRRMYGHEEILVVLATFGVFLILEDLILLIFGVNPYFAYQPMVALGNVELGGIFRDVYSLTLFAVASAVALASWWVLTRTRWGKLIAAVIHDREMALSIGINVSRVYVVTFCAGAVLGALGGAYIAPTVSVAPGFAVDIIVLSFAVVVIGGMGSIPGALIGALLVGLLRALAVHKMPELELFVIFLVMSAVLIVRPEGLFAPEQARKI